MRYVEFAYADPFFYDQLQASGSPGYPLSGEVDWAKWDQRVEGGWHHLRPPGIALPDQGWKVHASATLDNAAQMLELVSGYCGRQQITFKFRAGRTELLRINLKYADRGSSGKFITIYPADEHACEQILTDLDALIGGMAGPYVLSDLRWHDGPLYLRYGGFRPMQVRDQRDRLVAAVQHPAGHLVPDRREPAFTPPDWVPLPPFVTAAQKQLNTDAAFGYQIREALHFSNGGGVYRAERLSDGAVVVLKEARPHAGLGPDGRDAVERLNCEHDHLQRLREIASVVDVLDRFERFGHQFLVLEHVEGRTLNQELAARHPMISSGTTAQDRATYRDWALGVLEQVEAALRDLHKQGQVHGDLHPGNVIVTPQGTVRFIDLEMSYRQDSPHPGPAGAPGFTAPDGRTGVRADLYALACLKIALFVPLTVLLPLDRHKARQLITEAVDRFGLGRDFHAEVLGGLLPDPPTRPVRRVRDLMEAWPIDSADGVLELEATVGRGIRESLDLSRNDRAFPGDISQFSHDALSIAHGACGVLLALPDPDPQHSQVLDWVNQALARTARPNVGFFDGITGIAHTMRYFGRHETADRLYSDICQLPFDQLPGDLSGGLAGIGLGLLAEHSRGGDVLDALQAIRTVLKGRTPSHRHGLLHGATGTALFWLRSYETFADSADLERARQALAVDLAACVERPDGSLQLNEGRRTVPYLGFGSIGVALVAMRLLEHRDDEKLRRAVRKVIRVTDSHFTIQPSLFNGRAGYVVFLAAVQNSPFADAAGRAALIRHTQDLGLYALGRGTGIHFPGEQMLRASVDWASGSAGVLTALRAYAGVIHGHPTPEPPLLGLLNPRKEAAPKLLDLRDAEISTVKDLR